MQVYETKPDLNWLQAEIDINDRMYRYLKYVISEEDIKKTLSIFNALCDDITSNLLPKKGKGFFLMPVHRLLSNFVTRIVMKELLERPDVDLSNVLVKHLGPE